MTKTDEGLNLTHIRKTLGRIMDVLSIYEKTHTTPENLKYQDMFICDDRGNSVGVRCSLQGKEEKDLKIEIGVSQNFQK